MLAAEYPGALWVPADSSNYLARNRMPGDIKHIVIHITSGRELAQPVADMWREPGHGSSTHFVIGQIGAIIQAVALKNVAYHAHSANRSSVGIEHCAREPNEPRFPPMDPGLPVSDAQYQASAKLVAWLCDRFKLPRTRDVIVGHCEIDLVTTHTNCPNAIWDWDKYMALVGAVLV